MQLLYIEIFILVCGGHHFSQEYLGYRNLIALQVLSDQLPIRGWGAMCK